MPQNPMVRIRSIGGSVTADLRDAMEGENGGENGQDFDGEQNEL